MLIQCTSCGTQAKIPSSKEGAKVKCPSCGHVYVARAGGGRGGRSSSGSQNSTLPIVIGVGVVGTLIIAFFFLQNSGGGDDPVDAAETPATPEKKDDKPYVAFDSFEGPPLAFARSLHDAANAGNTTRLRSLMAAEAAYAAHGEELPEDAEPLAPWTSLDQAAQLAAKDAIIAPLLDRGEDAYVAGWKAWDGIYMEDAREGFVHRVRLRLQPVDGATGDRWVEWTLLQEGDVFRWIDADRHYTNAELADIRRGNRKRPEKVTLEDGQTVYEGEVTAIGYDDDVPAETRAEIDAIIDGLFISDSYSNREYGAAKDELARMGPPAVAALLNQLSVEAGEPADTDGRDRDIFTIDQVLQQITGDSNNTLQMGATEEQIESGVKQWFAWYDRRYKSFKRKWTSAAEAAGGATEEYVDPLEGAVDLDSMNARERREYEKAKREMQKGGGN